MTAIHWGLIVALAAAQSSSYPPPFPREGATKMLDNDRVQVWNVARRNDAL